MGSVNNNIKKPFISVGYDKTGKLTFNVDLNKVRKMDNEKLSEAVGVLNSINMIVKNAGSTNAVETITNRKQILKDVDEFCLSKNTILPKVVDIDSLVEIEMLLKNNRKLEAVKRFKDSSGCGLRDAKNFVEYYQGKKRIKTSYEKNHKFYFEIP